ncbi:DMT family transporter [Neobacillus sp. SAB-20_R2A]|uniref:DMT family transporter n=1 Tax=Neobacillus sp. SAB-20_R2A TaxID=3120519 RepID=UPI003C6E2A41
MGWFYLILGAFLEVGWAFGLTFSRGFTNLIITIVTILLILLSFFFFSLALKSIAIGVAYAAFTGLGTVGTVVGGAIFLDETLSIVKTFFVLLLIVGIIGLKLTTTDEHLKMDAEGSKISNN